jgi:FkbM family methyltransferase
VTVHIRPLDVDIPLRPGTSDALDVVDSLVGRHHLPPEDIVPATIVDAGLCTGLTLIDLAIRYPSARLIGIEPQPYYANLCRSLTQRFGARVKIIEAAVAPEDRSKAILHVTEGQEFAASLAEPQQPTETTIDVTAVSLNSIVDDLGSIDYLNLDVEGTEREILRKDTEWMARTRCIKVECHHGYTVEECAIDLARGGFFCSRYERHWCCMIGVKESSAAHPRVKNDHGEVGS